MTRALYRCILLLHPPAFRRRFADEMLGIFEEPEGEIGAPALVADGLASLLRQWIRTPAVWKLAAIALGNVPFLYFSLPIAPTPRDAVRLFTTQEFLIVAALAPLVTISIGLILAVSWFRFAQRRRT
jgi:hypothetical protein